MLNRVAACQGSNATAQPGLMPAARVAATDAKNDAFDAPQARIQLLRAVRERHAAAGDECPHLDGVIRGEAVRFLHLNGPVPRGSGAQSTAGPCGRLPDRSLKPYEAEP